MQDVTDLAFWRLMANYGGADLYFTEYFRVHACSRLDRHILRSITENPTGRPAIAQLIGNDPTELVRTARELQRHPIMGIDLNLGCPAPVVYRKCAGGGLLRDLAKIELLLGALRDAIAPPLTFSVKTRLGFDSTAPFEPLLELFSKHHLDLITVHGRTVTEMYRSEVHYDFIRRAVKAMNCPVIANGNITSVADAHAVLQCTAAAGLMIGRGAIRNPWLFEQIRQSLGGQKVFIPTGRDVLAYVHALYEATTPDGLDERVAVQKLKKYMNFLGAGLEPTGAFLHASRRLTTREELFSLCAEFMDHDEPMALTPFTPCSTAVGAAS